MTRPADDFADRLYARVPAHYRAYDEELAAAAGQSNGPLRALLGVVGRQAAVLRDDLDDLWDAFFIDSCPDWVVPYLGALVGVTPLPFPDGPAARAWVRSAVAWRRTRGTPAMLRAAAAAVTGWPTDVAEFFRGLGWSQNVNHTRLDRTHTPDLRDPAALALLGRAADPFARAAEFKPGRDLDRPRVAARSRGVGVFGWGTPGRHRIKTVGLFVRRLRPFPIRGAEPAAVPRADGTPSPDCFTFDPLGRDVPLFAAARAEPIARAAFARNPWPAFGTDVGVRQYGLLLAADAAPQPNPTRTNDPFTFGGAAAGLSLDAARGLEIVDLADFGRGAPHFVLTAVWEAGGAETVLGTLDTLAATTGGVAFEPGGPLPGAGRLAITVEASAAGRFPGAVLAVRAANTGPARLADAAYVYLPAGYVAPGEPLRFPVGADGSTTRDAEGGVFPARVPTESTAPAAGFTRLNRRADGLRVADPGRFGAAPPAVTITAELFTGAYQELASIATVDRPGGHPDPAEPDPWPAFRAAPTRAALDGKVPGTGLLTIRIVRTGGGFVPAVELIVGSRRGGALLVYLPEVENAPPDGLRVFVADDGSTFYAPADAAEAQGVSRVGSLVGLPAARAAVGQVLPIPGAWPLRHRRPAAADLCRSERARTVRPGELGIDPEAGRFAFAPGDAAAGAGGLTVDTVVAAAGPVGALGFDRGPESPATRFVARSGDADSPLAAALAGAPVHTTLAAAVAAAADGDVIEIVDSRTDSGGEVALAAAAVRRLTVRAAAGRRPCLVFPAAGALRVSVAMDELELTGLLLGGGPVRLGQPVAGFRFLACTHLPPAGADSVVAEDADRTRAGSVLVCRSVCGPLRLGAGVARLTAADSVLDPTGGVAVSGPTPASPGPTVQLERVTVLGSLWCDVLFASDCLLDDVAKAEDAQAGCVRYTRYERGSVLPAPFRCVPTEVQLGAVPPPRRCLPPRFNARRPDRPGYAQLSPACPPEVLAAGERGGEVGAYAGSFVTQRLANLRAALAEFLPAGLIAAVVAET